MFDVKYISPLVGVIIGWFLKEVSQMVRLHREDRRAIGQVLTDLMEIRYRLLGIEKISDEIKRFKISVQEQLLLKSFIDNILSNLQDLNKRYEKRVNTIASADPLLGFQLRSKDLLNPYISQIRSIASMSEDSATIWNQIEVQLIESAEPEFERLILKLSWLHSWRTWLYTRRYLRRSLEIPPEFEELISSMIEQNKQSETEENPSV